MSLSMTLMPALSITEDVFRRRVSYLRLSLTDRCNLRCRYCMPNTGMKFFSDQDLLSLDEIKRLLKIFHDLGVTKVRFTGGEPLLRKECEPAIQAALQLGIQDVSITTNGLLLSSRVASLKKAGLKRINISLDTLQRHRFKDITGADALDLVLNSIEGAIQQDLNPVKINMVVMREWNLDEIGAFALFAKQNPVEVRFLELMPTVNTFEGTAGVSPNSFVSMNEIKQRVESIVPLGPEEASSSVAKVFPILGGRGKVGFISPVSNHFCERCNRIRLTARGRLKTCLHGEESLDLKKAMAQGASDPDLAQGIRQALLLKPEEHFIRPDHYISRNLQMSQVGG